MRISDWSSDVFPSELPPAKRRFARQQVELPHAAEALTELVDEVGAGCLEAVVPLRQCFGVMQSPDFEIVQEQAAFFQHRQGFGRGRDVATGKDVFADPGIATAGRDRKSGV